MSKEHNLKSHLNHCSSLRILVSKCNFKRLDIRMCAAISSVFGFIRTQGYHNHMINFTVAHDKEHQITNSYPYGISNNRLSNATQGKQGTHTLAGWLLSVSVILPSQASGTYVRTRNMNHCPLLDNLQTNLIDCSLSHYQHEPHCVISYRVFFMDHQLRVHREFTELPLS